MSANTGRRTDIHQKQVLDQMVVKTAAATLEIYETQVRANTTAGAMTITLPAVAEAKGLFFSIIFETDGGDLTIADQDDSYDFTDEVFDNALDRIMYYSDGFVWWVMSLDEV